MLDSGSLPIYANLFSQTPNTQYNTQHNAAQFTPPAVLERSGAANSFDRLFEKTLQALEASEQKSDNAYKPSVIDESAQNDNKADFQTESEKSAAANKNDIAESDYKENKNIITEGENSGEVLSSKKKEQESDELSAEQLIAGISGTISSALENGATNIEDAEAEIAIVSEIGTEADNALSAASLEENFSVDNEKIKNITETDAKFADGEFPKENADISENALAKTASDNKEKPEKNAREIENVDLIENTDNSHFPVIETVKVSANNLQNQDTEQNEAQDKKRSGAKKLKVDVLDARTENGGLSAAQIAENSNGGEAKAQVKETVLEVSLPDSAKSQTTTADGSQQRLATGAELKSASHFENFLSRELHNGLNGDIVRQAQIVLKDGGEGLIRLQLHPESLGNVRIKLALSGNRVEGIITVESPEALNAFENELASLETAFRDSGFEGASLDMRMAGGQADNSEKNEMGQFAFSRALNYEVPLASNSAANKQAASIYERGGLSILA